MKQVTRYRCDFCGRTYAKAATVERHEKECCQNPDGVNCFLCVHSYIGDWSDDDNRAYKDEPICRENELRLREVKRELPGREGHKSYAPLCEDFKRRPPGKYIGYLWEDGNG
ncbi:MAG: hypothetical protein LBS19_02160 [Clostridiales bacterium]|nr:hypothetical protein [Clostridiales bacterium]